MRTVRSQFKQIIMIFSFMVVSVYNPVFAEETQAHDPATHQAKKDWSGIYRGATPCQDCYGIKTELALNKNNSYIIITQKLGQSPRDYVEKGKFNWDETSNIVTLTPRKDGTTKKYLMGEGTMTQLDDNGNRISGAEADRYILHKINVTKSGPEEHRMH